jgi:hypothetical protein
VGTGLYSKKAKRLEAKRAEFVTQWWDVSYDDYIAGNDIAERDTTCLFDIYKKYMPERSRIQEKLFKEVSLDSEEGRQCLHAMVSLCTSTEKVAYYPGLGPVRGLCPICETPMFRYFPNALDISRYVTLTCSRFGPQGRAKHILQCRRKALNAAPYQQCYKNGKRAHRRVNRSYLQFCYLCAQFVSSEEEWEDHCEYHLAELQIPPTSMRYFDVPLHIGGSWTLSFLSR